MLKNNITILINQAINVGVRDMVVANTSIATIPDVVLRQKVLFVNIPFGTINRGTLPRSPELG